MQGKPPMILDAGRGVKVLVVQSLRKKFGNFIKSPTGTSLAVQWLRLCASTAGGAGSISGRGTKILEKEMATHSSTLARRIPWTEEPGGLQSMGLRRVGRN